MVSATPDSLAYQQAGRVESGQVLGHRSLAQSEVLRALGDAVIIAQEVAQQTDTSRVGQGGEDIRELLRFGDYFPVHPHQHAPWRAGGGVGGGA